MRRKRREYAAGRATEVLDAAEKGSQAATTEEVTMVLRLWEFAGSRTRKTVTKKGGGEKGGVAEDMDLELQVHKLAAQKFEIAVEVWFLQ